MSHSVYVPASERLYKKVMWPLYIFKKAIKMFKYRLLVRVVLTFDLKLLPRITVYWSYTSLSILCDTAISPALTAV